MSCSVFECLISILCYETLRKNSTGYENTAAIHKPKTAIVGLPGFASPRTGRKGRGGKGDDAMALYARVDRSKKKKNRDSGGTSSDGCSSGSQPCSPSEGPSSQLSPTKSLIQKFNSIGLTNSHHTVSCNTNLPQVDVASKSKSSSAVIKIQNDAELEKHQHKHVIRVTSNPQQDPDSQARFRPTTLYSSSLHQNRHQQNLNLQQQPKKPICTSTTSLNTNQSPPNNEPMYATIGSNQKRLLSSLKSANVWQTDL